MKLVTPGPLPLTTSDGLEDNHSSNFEWLSFHARMGSFGTLKLNKKQWWHVD